MNWKNYKKINFDFTSKQGHRDDNLVCFLNGCHLIAVAGFSQVVRMKNIEQSFQTKLQIILINSKTHRVVKVHQISVVFESTFWRPLAVSYSPRLNKLFFAFQDTYYVMTRKSCFQKCQQYPLTCSKGKWKGYISKLHCVEEKNELLLLRKGGIRKTFKEEVIIISLADREYETLVFGFGQTRSIRYLPDYKLLAACIQTAEENSMLVLINPKTKDIVSGIYTGLCKPSILQYFPGKNLLLLINESDSKDQLLVYGIQKGEFSLEFDLKLAIDDKSKSIKRPASSCIPDACYNLTKDTESLSKVVLIDQNDLSTIRYLKVHQRCPQASLNIGANFIAEYSANFLILQLRSALTTKISGPAIKSNKGLSTIDDGKNKRKWRDLLMLEGY